MSRAIRFAAAHRFVNTPMLTCFQEHLGVRVIGFPFGNAGGFQFAPQFDAGVEAVDQFADAVLAASIFHFAEYSVHEAKEYMAESGIEVRL